MGDPRAPSTATATAADYRHIGRALRQSIEHTATLRRDFAALSAREKRRLILELIKII